MRNKTEKIIFQTKIKFYKIKTPFTYHERSNTHTSPVESKCEGSVLQDFHIYKYNQLLVVWIAPVPI